MTTSPSHPQHDSARVDHQWFSVESTPMSPDSRVSADGASYLILVRLATSGAQGRAVVMNPGEVARAGDLDLGWDDRSADLLRIRLDRTLVVHELQTLMQRAADSDVVFERELDLCTGPTKGLVPLLEGLADQLVTPHEVSRHPAVWLRSLRTLLAACLLFQPHSFQSSVREGQSPSRPRHLRRAMRFVHEHAAEPLSLGDLARAAGCSARTLNSSFTSHLGVTPMVYVRHVRLERVRGELQDSDEHVATVAYRWGFTHLGRFSAYYAQRYGERPSATLARFSRAS